MASWWKNPCTEQVVVVPDANATPGVSCGMGQVDMKAAQLAQKLKRLNISINLEYVRPNFSRLLIISETINKEPLNRFF